MSSGAGLNSIFRNDSRLARPPDNVAGTALGNNTLMTLMGKQRGY